MKYIFPFLAFSLFFFSGCGNDEERANINGANPTQNEQTYNGESQNTNEVKTGIEARNYALNAMRQEVNYDQMPQKLKKIFDERVNYISSNWDNNISEQGSRSDIEGVISVKTTGDGKVSSILVDYYDGYKYPDGKNYSPNLFARVYVADYIIPELIDQVEDTPSSDEDIDDLQNKAELGIYLVDVLGIGDQIQVKRTGDDADDWFRDRKSSLEGAKSSPEKQAILDEFEAKLRAGDIEGAVNGLVVKENCGLLSVDEAIKAVKNVFQDGEQKTPTLKLIQANVREKDPIFGCEFYRET